MSVDRSISFRALVDAAPDAVLVCDRRGDLALINRAAEQMFGYGRDELHGRSLDLVLPEAQGPRQTLVDSAMADPAERTAGPILELLGWRKDGGTLPVEVRLSPFDEDGELYLMAGIRDVSERREPRDDKPCATAFLLSAIETVQDAFLLFDEHDRLMMMNNAALEMLRTQTSAPAIGQRFEELIHGAIRGGLYDLQGVAPEAWYAARLAYHRAPVGVLDVQLQGGRCMRVTERKIPSRGTVMTIADMTADVAQAEELRRARAQAEAASAAKSEFLSSMSHELRTPLNAILGFAQLLERDRKHPLGERQLERLAEIVSGGEHLLRLIDDILDLSRIEAGRISISTEPVAVADLIHEVVRTLQLMAARAEIRVITADLPRQLPAVLADRTRLVQVLLNLGSNAIKYGKPRGVVTLRGEQRGDQVRIAVIDDGIGIPDDMRDKIFEPFQRAGQELGSIEGTGIGLTISKRLVELMAGQLGFSTEVGRGSEFWIELPVYDGHAADRLVMREDPGVGNRLENSVHRHAVVYVEDNPSNIAFMRDLFDELMGVELLTAPTAEIGLALIRGRLPQVVIMDVNLPGMSGLDAVRQLQAWPETRAIPVIGLSAAALERDKLRAEQLGFYRYLTKPVRVDELLGTLEYLLEGGPTQGPRSD